jgi:hypothetical protein
LGCGKYGRILKMSVLDLTGQRYGKLTVVSRTQSSKGYRMYNVVCDCGNHTTATTRTLRDGKRTACSKDCMYPDLTGHTIGKITILARSSKPFGRSGKYWSCKCSLCNRVFVKSSRVINKTNGGCTCSHKAPFGRTSFRALISRYKCSAVKRGFELNLTENDFKKLFESNCMFCGKPPSQVSDVGTGQFIYNGIDRLNPKVGYVIGNVGPCCKSCNLRKGKLSLSEFKEWITSVYNNFCMTKKEDK